MNSAETSSETETGSKAWQSWDHWIPEANLTVSQWADKERILTRMTTSEPGRWRTSRVPYAREIMDSFSDPMVEEITMMTSTRVSKTEMILNMLGYSIRFTESPMMVVLPTRDDIKEWVDIRFKSMIDASSGLKRQTTGKEDDLAGTLLRFRKSFLKVASSNSPADLAQRACCYVFFDETNKFPPFSGKEANPISLGTERTRTFWDRKIVKASTPTHPKGIISLEYLKSDQRRYWVPCPLCGCHQRLGFSRTYNPGLGQVVWPSNATPNEIREERLARYECLKCKGKIVETSLEWMISKGVWCPKGLKVNDYGELIGDQRPSRHRGYAISALYAPWPFTTWSQLAAEFLECKVGG